MVQMNLVQGPHFYCSKKLNNFGNYQRFTGTTGGYTDLIGTTFYDKDGNTTTEALAFPNDLLLDWDTYNKYGNNNILMIIRKAVAGTNVNWENCRLWASALTIGGYTDWRMPNIRMLTNLIYYYNPQPLNMPIHTAHYISRQRFSRGAQQVTERMRTTP